MAKAPDAYRTISEAAEEVGVPAHVLRFWETKFRVLQPLKRTGGRRLYRPEDLAALKALKRLLHEQGYTIRGVQQLQKSGALRRIIGGEAAAPAPSADVLEGALDRLEAASARLKGAVGG